MKLTNPQQAALESIADGATPTSSLVIKNLLAKGLIKLGTVSDWQLTDVGREALGLMTVAEAAFAGLTEHDDATAVAAELPTADEDAYTGQAADELDGLVKILSGLAEIEQPAADQRFRVTDDTPVVNPQQGDYGLAMLSGLGSGSGKHVYGGTANDGKVNKRRAKARVARKSRKANRRG
jgi:hypothetical protein